MPIRQTVDAALLRAALALPHSVQRRLAGPPVVIDGQTLDVETQLMLRLQEVAKIPGAETLPIPEGRRAILHQSTIAGGRPGVGAVRDLAVAGLPARLYTPTHAAPGPGPLLVFLHGGGFMYGDLESHDAPCRVIAERSGVPVLAVDYRLAPEHPFPAAYDDAVAAYRWVVEHAADLGADPGRLAVGGDSAGGNLAAGIALVAADEGLPLAFQLLVYPVTVVDRPSRSRELFGKGFFLTTGFIDLATESYHRDSSTHEHPGAAPALADVPDGLAPALVVTAGFDPLRDEGEEYARRLSEAGVAVELRRFPGQIHGFLNVVGVGRQARAAVLEVADRLAVALR